MTLLKRNKGMKIMSSVCLFVCLILFIALFILVIYILFLHHHIAQKT
jgi:hypothetical protein